ncbi:hypothetical protein GCM10017567_78320 [Amycolatopsis bullii]|uniref:Uncharacterized protein n=1 Tax=Amycolatopsis bullii TaxID=941987 RepID=A0ABQ3KPV4_9PSEU|nr:hypothetical protein GCM10017567_78320 [Amycolatopsis bullii]
MRCPVCGEESLSPLADLDASNWLVARFKRPGLLESRPSFAALHARVCRSCGALLPFLDQKQRDELAEEWDTLIPVAPDPKPETPPSPESPS